MPVSIRATSYITTSPTTVGSYVLLPFPTGTVVGDRVIIFSLNNGIGIYDVSGWDLIGADDKFAPLQYAWSVQTKAMDASDIATGSVLVQLGTVGGAIPPQVWAVVATDGSVSVRESPYLGDNSGSAPTTETVVTDSHVATTDIGVFFGSKLANVIPVISPGTAFAHATSSAVSGGLAIDTALSAGVNTISYTYTGAGGLPAFQVAVILGASGPPALSISCDNPPGAIKGSPYSHLFPASGGTPPYTFSIISGSLPPGLTLNASTGSVTGTPTAIGNYPFVIEVTDSLAATADVSCSITVASVGAWVIQEVTAELIPSDPYIPGYGHFRYTVRAVNQAQTGTYLGFWASFGGGGGDNGSSVSANTSGGGAPTQPPSDGSITIAKNTVVVGQEPEIDFIEGRLVGITALDDGHDSRVDLTFASTADNVLLKAASYAILSSDDGNLISFNSGSAITATLPATPPTAPWRIGIENIGAGTLTIAHNGNVIDLSAADLTVRTDQGLYIYSNGTQYYTERGLAGISGVTVQHNDVTVATEPTLDFEDSPTVVVTATDDPTNSRVKLSFVADGVGSYQALAKRTFSWTSQTSVTLTHNIGSQFVVVQVYDASGNLVEPQTCVLTSANVTTLTFGAAFTGSAVVLGVTKYTPYAVYTQGFVSATSVTVTHNLNNPNVIVQVYDSSNAQAIAQNVQITNSNTVVLTFGAAFSGDVIVISQPPPIPQSATITWVSQTLVTVYHNLQTTAVVVEVFDAGGNEVIPQAVTVVDDHTVTLTFAVSFSGSATIIG